MFQSFRRKINITLLGEHYQNIKDMRNTTDSRYIVVIYSTIIHTVQNYNDTTSVSTGKLWGVFREIFKKMWPRHIWSALYLTSDIIIAADDFSKTGYEAYVAKIGITCFAIL